jgi:hypothetical protein
MRASYFAEGVTTSIYDICGEVYHVMVNGRNCVLSGICNIFCYVSHMESFGLSCSTKHATVSPIITSSTILNATIQGVLASSSTSVSHKVCFGSDKMFMLKGEVAS